MIELARVIQSELIACAQSYPVVTIIGSRQSGKTTLVKSTFPDKCYVNLEEPDLREFAHSDPRAFLSQYPDGAVLDEIQRVPELLSYIQSIVDTTEQLGQFILTGSHQLQLQAEITQSLAGRTGMLHLMPLSLTELAPLHLNNDLDTQLLYGFYPRIYKYHIAPQRFYRDYVQTYLERDVKMLIHIRDLDQFQRFLNLCATRIGQLIDYTQMANELGISRHTIKHWLSILKASFVVTTLPPYFENLGKRIIKSSKLYFNDVGLACYLLGINSAEQVRHHPLRGYLFENLVVNEVSKLLLNQGKPVPLYFYRDSNQLEVDLLFQWGTSVIAIEIKSSATFSQSFLTGLKRFEHLKKTMVKSHIIYGGEHQQTTQNCQVLNYRNIASIISEK